MAFIPSKKKKIIPKSTSWEKGTASWYSKLVGEKGHYYHKKVIFPNVLRMLKLGSGDTIIDVGCGQGVFARMIPENVRYFGIDASQALISLARKMNANKKCSFEKCDALQMSKLALAPFSHACAILSLQNMKDPERVIANISKNISEGGSLVIVLNHPCFRIPRQSGWGTLRENQLQFRWISRYMSSMEIPIETYVHHGKKTRSWSFHYPLFRIFQALNQSNFSVIALEEWTSDKESVGKNAKKENRSRAEIPLFMAIKCRKV